SLPAASGSGSSNPSQFWSIPSPGMSIAPGLIDGSRSLQSKPPTLPSPSRSTGTGTSARRANSQPLTASSPSTCASSSLLGPQSTVSGSLSKASSESSSPGVASVTEIGSLGPRSSYVAVSVPGPPSIVSVPKPPRIVSSPAPPSIVSFPGPALIESLPSPVEMLSSAVVPVTTSLPL